MLVLKRHLDQSIMIGPDVEVTIVEIGTQNVKLGIVAPKDMAVHRKEVFVRIAKERSSQ